jgi:hypothetical protein
MIYDSLPLHFNREALKQGIALGIYPTREVLVNSTVAVKKTDGVWPEAYESWCQRHGYQSADNKNGDILTTAYDADYLARRMQAMTDQLGRVNLGGFNIPDCVMKAYADVAASKQPGDVLGTTILSTGRWNLHFDLQEKLPDVKLRTTYAAVNEKYAADCNQIIQNSDPTLSENLEFSNVWTTKPSDIVLIEFAVLYEDEAGLENLARQIAKTGAKRAAFTNVLPNLDGQAAYWAAQPSDGGYIPIRIPAKGELTAVMKRAGYKPAHEPVFIASNFPIDPRSGYKKQYPFIEHHVFELAA